MPVPTYRQRIAVLKRIGDVVLDYARAADSREAAAERDRTQSRVDLSACDTKARISISEPRPIEHVCDEDGAVEHDPSLVDDRGTEDPRPVESDVLRTVEALARELDGERATNAVGVEVSEGVPCGHVTRVRQPRIDSDIELIPFE